ncbi:hypothetical protein KPL71_019331 [Citrus sinensis]|uniref:Uncharacterized protein n=1 Tax=Citrus sinensis TaxID=2711 RepID=A0ACB8K5J9_CITSI|nr:hypothetical protein KPL71_019331 [Citrus sinensis]
MFVRRICSGRKILGSKKANKKEAPVTTLSDGKLKGLVYVNEKFDGLEAECLRKLQSKLGDSIIKFAPEKEALDLKLPFREIEVPQGNFGLGEVEILSVSDPDALAKAGSLSCLLNQNPLSPGNPKAIFLR